MEDKILVSRKTLASRWDFDSVQSIQNYEERGVLTRNPNFETPRYYMEEVLQVEALREINPLSPLERKRLENKISRLEMEVDLLKDKLSNIKLLVV